MTPQVAAAIAVAVWRSVQPVQLLVAAQLLRKRARIIQIHNLCLFIKSPFQHEVHATRLNIYMISKIIKIGENPNSSFVFPYPARWRTYPPLRLRMLALISWLRLPTTSLRAATEASVDLSFAGRVK
jgi:hypothetical protein